MHRRLKVIVVEDDPALRTAFCATLAQDPYIVTAEAKDMEEALALCHNETQIALLVDPGLPNLRGVEAVSVLHRTLPGAPLVAITGNDDLRRPALDAGATEVVIKASPESMGQKLIDTIRKAAVANDTALQFGPGWDLIREIKDRLAGSTSGKLAAAAVATLVALGTWRADLRAEAQHLRDRNAVRALAGEWFGSGRAES